MDFHGLLIKCPKRYICSVESLWMSMDVHGLLLKVHAKSTQSPHQVHTESMQVHTNIFPLFILSMDFCGLFKYFGLSVQKVFYLS